MKSAIISSCLNPYSKHQVIGVTISILTVHPPSAQVEFRKFWGGNTGGGEAEASI